MEHGYVYGCSDDVFSKLCPGPAECPIKAEALTLNELVEERVKQLSAVKIHPLIDYHPETGLTIGIFGIAKNQSVIFLAEKPIKVQNNTPAKWNPFAKPISLIQLKWAKLRENWERQMISIIEEYSKKGKIEFPAQNEVFEETLAQINKYFYHSDGRVYVLVVCWIIATYFHPLFEYFPILNLQGQRETGKTTLLAILEQTCWNPTGQETALSEAALFRTIQDSRPTYIVDITGMNPKSPRYFDVVDVCEKGTEKGGVVRRCQPKSLKPLEWQTYGPKAVATREELPFTVKCIRVITEKAPGKEYSLRRHMLEFDEKWPRIVNMLLKAAIKYWPQVLQAYRELEPTGKLMGRSFNYWQPILAVCKVFAPNRYSELVGLAEEMTMREQIADQISFAEEAILIWASTQDGSTVTVSLGDLMRICQEFNPEIKGWKTVFSALENLSIHKEIQKTTKGYKIRIDVERAKRKAEERGITAEGSSESVTVSENSGATEETGRKLTLDDLKAVYWTMEPSTEKKCCVCGCVKRTFWKAETFKGEVFSICEDCAKGFEEKRGEV